MSAVSGSATVKQSGLSRRHLSQHSARSPFALRYLNEEWTDHAVWRNQALTWVKASLL